MRKRGRPPYPDILTPREWEVLSLLREGLTNEQIAERLNITIHAARYHVSEILSKLGVASRQEAAAWEREEARPLWMGALAWALWPLKHIPFATAAKASAAAVVVGAASGIGFLVWGLIVTSGQADLSDQAEAGEVTHIRASMTMVEPDGSNGAAGFEETWVDTTGAFVRTEQRDSDDKVVRVAVRRVNNERELDLNEEGAPRFRMESYSDAVSGWVATEVGGPLYFRDFFRGTNVETIGPTEVDGRAAIIVRVPPPQRGVNRRPVEGVVDEETGWPFEIRLFQRNDTGGFDPAGKWVVKYELVEALPIESVSHLFEIESTDRDAVSYREMSLANARAFSGFRLLYLGDSFDGMALKSITYSSPRDDPPTQQVFLIYAEWAGKPPIRIVRQLDVAIKRTQTVAWAHRQTTPAITATATPSWAQPSGEVIVTPKGEALFTEYTPLNSRLELLTDGVLVTIQGENVPGDQVLRAAQALVSLNPGVVRPSSPTAAASSSPTP